MCVFSQEVPPSWLGGWRTVFQYVGQQPRKDLRPRAFRAGRALLTVFPSHRTSLLLVFCVFRRLEPHHERKWKSFSKLWFVLVEEIRLIGRCAPPPRSSSPHDCEKGLKEDPKAKETVDMKWH